MPSTPPRPQPAKLAQSFSASSAGALSPAANKENRVPLTTTPMPCRLQPLQSVSAVVQTPTKPSPAGFERFRASSASSGGAGGPASRSSGVLMNQAKVKNTFINFDSPLKTVAVLSPPKTAPSNFAPEVLGDGGQVLRTPAAVRAMFHASTPWTQTVHGLLPSQSCVAQSSYATAAVPAMPTAPAPSATAATLLGQQSGPLAAPLLRLSDFLPSPVPAAQVSSLTGAGIASHDASMYHMMQGGMDMISCWQDAQQAPAWCSSLQGFECLPPAMPAPSMPPALPPALPPAMPPVPPLPSVLGASAPANYGEPPPPQPPTVSISVGHFPEPGQPAMPPPTQPPTAAPITVAPTSEAPPVAPSCMAAPAPTAPAVVPSPPPTMPAPTLPPSTSVNGGTSATAGEGTSSMPPPLAHSSGTAALPSGAPPPPSHPPPVLLSNCCPGPASASAPHAALPTSMAPACHYTGQTQPHISGHMQPPQHFAGGSALSAQQIQVAHAAASAAAAAAAAAAQAVGVPPVHPGHYQQMRPMQQVPAGMPMLPMVQQQLQQPYAECYPSDMFMFQQPIA